MGKGDKTCSPIVLDGLVIVPTGPLTAFDVATGQVKWTQKKIGYTCCWPVVVNESLVQSYTGQIRVAPVKLKNTVRFARLRTVGAFLLSGEIQSGGKVSYLAITSEAGVPCNLLRPWDGPVRVRRGDSLKAVTVAEKDGVLTFPTAAGATYVVDRPDEPWEAQPITVITQTPH